MADQEDFATAVGALIKGRYKIGDSAVLPDRGRARTIADDPINGFASADDVTASGRWQVWSASDATALGLPNNVAGSFEIYSFGNVVEQVYRQHYSLGIIEIGRRKSGTTWSAWLVLGVDDTSVAALVSPGTETHTAIRGMIPATSAPKTAAVALSTGDSGTTKTVTDTSFRYPVKLGADATRFRVHIQNGNPRYGNRVPGALNFTGLGIARNAGEITGPSADGQLDAATWQQISGAFSSNAFGWEWVSGWVDQPLKAGQGWVLSGGYTAAVGQSVTALVGGGWVTPSATDWNSTAVSLTLTQSVGLWVWLEVEVDARTPVIAYFGDSLGSGVSSRLPVYDGIGNRHSWAHGHIATLYTNSGTTMVDHLDETHFRWTRYATAEGLAKPDGVVFQMGTNDVFSGAGLALLKDRYAVCQDIISRKLSPRIMGMTVLPRHDPLATTETTRQAFNEWLLTSKAGELAGVVDSASYLADPAEPRQIDKRWTASSDDIHLTSSGYARYASGLPPLHT